MSRYIEQSYKNNNLMRGTNTINKPRRIDGNSFEKQNDLFSHNLFDEISSGKLSTNNLLAAHSNKIFKAMLPYLDKVSFTGNEYLFQPGDSVDFVYFPETAVFSEFQILEDGRTVEVAMIGREGILGFLPVFNSHRTHNWIQVSASGSAYKINSRIFKKEITQNPALQMLLFDYIGEYVKQISQRSVCNSYHTIEQRFCSWLLMLRDRKQSNKLPLTQEQIARYLGVHRPSVTHIAQTLRSKSIINYVRGKIFIRNPDELKRYACDCHAEIDKKFSANAV